MTLRPRHSILALSLLTACGGSSVCGDGLQLVQGQCLYECDPPCSSDQICNATTASAECECIVTGYEGTPCTWGGGLEDPQFQTSDAWTTGSTQLLSRAGPSGPGIASFGSIVACNAGAVSQVVEMPSYDEAEPFAIEIEYRIDNVGGVEIGYGRAFRRLAPKDAGDWNLDTFCLGEAGYGGPVKFQVAAAERRPDCFVAPIGEIEVDRFEIKVAPEGECPPPGQASNGTANVGGGGWTFDPPWTEGLQAGVGEADSDGARLFKPAESNEGAGMHVKLSVPLANSLPSPAVRFWWRGTNGWRFQAELGTYPGRFTILDPLDWLVGTGAPMSSVYCLPPRTHGNVVDLSFILTGAVSAEDIELVVDNVEIFSDPRCGSAVDLFDPSFASGPSRWPGTNIAKIPLGTDVNIIEPAGRTEDSGALELRYGSSGADLDIHSWVWAPATGEREGPALRFFSNAPADPGIGVFWEVGSGGPTAPCAGEFCPDFPLSSGLPLGLGWRKNLVCLPEEWAERWIRFRVALRRTDGPEEVFDPPRSVLLDDFEVTTDEACTD